MRELTAKWLTMLLQIIVLQRHRAHIRSTRVPLSAQYHRLILELGKRTQVNFDTAKLRELFSVFASRAVCVGGGGRRDRASDSIIARVHTIGNITMTLSVLVKRVAQSDRHCLTGCVINHMHCNGLEFRVHFAFKRCHRAASKVHILLRRRCPFMHNTFAFVARARPRVPHVHCTLWLWYQWTADFVSIGNAKR